jgi:hypothetical protein
MFQIRSAESLKSAGGVDSMSQMKCHVSASEETASEDQITWYTPKELWAEASVVAFRWLVVQCQEI